MGLIVILMMVGTLVILTGVVGSEAIVTMNAQTKDTVNDQAHYGAFSGVQCMLQVLAQDPGRSYTEPLNVTFPSTNPDLMAIVTVYNNMPGARIRSSEGPDAVGIPNNCVYIQSVSQILGKTATGSASVASFAHPHQVLYDSAVLGYNNVNLSNTTIDCYDTGVAPANNYAPYNITGNPPTLPTPARLAPIYTNGNTNGVMTLDTTSVVDGDIWVGSGSSSSAFAESNPSLDKSGSDQTQLSTKSLPKIGKPTGSAATDTFGPLVLTNTKNLLPGGVYVVNGDLEIASGGVLAISGTRVTGAANDDVFVYVDGNVTIHDGGIVNPGPGSDKSKGGTPNLQIYVSPTLNPVLNLTNSLYNNFVCTGQTVNVTLTNSSVFGAVQSAETTMVNSFVHYDVTLPSQLHGPAGWDVGAFVTGSQNLMGGGTGGTSGTTTTTSGTSGTAGTGTSGTGTSGTGGCGCGCGCGCGGGSL